MNGKFKLNFKERLEALGFRNFNDLSFWKDQLNVRRQRKNKVDMWVVENDGKLIFEDKSAVKCVEYMENNS
ncbi:MAG TPA: hypothetical protein PK816_13000 [Candidatus Cloacimonadota bacterium]|nr:hypothetical protein [Candidatus Cloacimonadota bacterium]